MSFPLIHSPLLALGLLLGASSLVLADDWPQGSGPNGSFEVKEAAPTEWSVALDKNIAWKITLPETGQNTPVVAAGKVFFSTLQSVEADSELGKDIVAWCCDASNGTLLWKKVIEGQHPLRLSGCFSDSSSPPAVCDGERAVFINASGGITAFDLDGNVLWSKETLSVGRTLPFLHEGNIVFTRQIYPPDPSGNFPHTYADSPKEMWTQLLAVDMKTGEPAWITECGLNMGCAILPQTLKSGKAVAVVGRGGGHGPPEKPAGISLVDLADGSTLWTLPLEKFMATMSFRIRNDLAHIFHGTEHLSVDALTGEVIRRSSIVEDVPVRMWNGGNRSTERKTIEGKKSRMITQTSNLLVGKWHYFRSYIRPWLGRVNVDDGMVEYLELPLQLSRMPETDDKLLWYVEQQSKKDPKLENQTFVENDMKNSRGFVVFGDKRSKGSGWGHIASPIPSVAGDNLYVPVMNGTVYVIDWNAKVLDENAVVSINDLGSTGKSYTRAGISFSNGKAFAHTIRELICIQQ